MSGLAFAALLLRDAGAILIVKATVVLALADGVAAAAKCLSAAQRHMIRLVALSSCVWLVLSSGMMPAITIQPPMVGTSFVATGPHLPGGALPSAGSAATTRNPGVHERFPSIEGTPRVSRSFTGLPRPWHSPTGLWIAGCVILLVRHAIGVVGTMRLARRAFIPKDDATNRELTSAAASVGLRRRVRLRYSTEVQSPITFGSAMPIVLVPSAATSWSSDRRRAVLVHEAAHISRGDWLAQLIGRLACDLFWFHPLAWRALARLRDDAERAADDVVLRSGMPAVEYATHLLELARRNSNSRNDTRFGSVAVGVVSTSHLERRFVAMFDLGRSRAGVSSRARAITTSVALAIVCPLSSLHVATPPLPHRAHGETKSRSFAAIVRTKDRTSRPVAAVKMRKPIVSRSFAALGMTKRDSGRFTLLRVTTTAPDSVSSAIASTHPDFSGRWTSDSLASRPINDVVTDSLVITQSASAISFDALGHILNVPTRNHFHRIPFDGAESLGFTSEGNAAANVIVYAVWAGDTLVLTSHAQAYGQVLLTTERLTLSPDRSTLLDSNVSFLDGQYRWGGAHTFVLRRMAP